MRRTVGIQDVGAYFGAARVEVDELFQARGLDTSRAANLMMSRKSLALPCEDIVTFAANAARPVLDRLSPEERGRIETLVVATESGVDLAKSAAAFVLGALGLPRTCRVFEVKQACHGGIAALQVVAGSLATGHEGARALVIAGDTPLPLRGSMAEPSQGAGAIAVLLGEAVLATWHPERYGSFSFDNDDFFRPRPDTDIIKVDHSIMSYIDSLVGSFDTYAGHTGADFHRDFAALAMHTPFPGMVKGAHRTALRKLAGLSPAVADADFTDRVRPSLEVPRQVGNIYAGCTLMAVASALRHGPSGQHELGVFSYGGGSSSEFLGLTASAGRRSAPAMSTVDSALAARTPVDVARYDQLLDAAARVGFGTRDGKTGVEEHADLLAHASAHTGPLLVLNGIEDYHRDYRWYGKEDGWLPTAS
ncbi:polyketide biosynthesis 3-hydroxy-3-methylglutaryl-CoA synthase-like enzyme PksG [Crossiella equi]|uniref:Polyketide biosynthesis 3-hydroxy-3-methylglutaryl-CoA synthase-like enzyme PksG n=1 Tax=Crossiella equi TaxID=130796 RepID=A0ABS5ASB4_9PSEU|nr:hydroxymethylglutaryl-CoA synthase [Crossiella equi]MBP2479456.1 polyketide biosynthesis 3-hydroxy-3-methylglutaryl-CoA synthase-like enzyme PksG [Crossiella equi]